MIDEILNIRHVKKSFPQGIVLDDINLNVVRGEILGIIGENGSGKSVLVRIISGELKEDQGEMFFEHRRFESGDIFRAQARGIFCLSAKSMLFDEMTVAENLICVRPKPGFGWMPDRKMNSLARLWLREFGLQISPGDLVKELTLVQKKQLELLKVILRDPKLLILDGFFPGLDGESWPWFSERIDELKKSGGTALVIASNLNLVMDICDRIAIMQDAQIAQIVSGEDIYLSSLYAVLRRSNPQLRKRGTLLTGKKVLNVRDVRMGKCVKASFSLYEGEVLGIYTDDTLLTDELISVLCGLKKLVSGEISIFGKMLKKFSMEELADVGICVIQEGMRNQMLLYEDTVIDNIVFFCMRRAMHYGIRKRKMERVAAKELAEEFGFSRGELNQEVSALSAGAKQRLAFANSRAIDTRIYILDNIMSHVDYESQEMLYDKMEELKKNGVSFLVIGREFEELRMVSDRIIYVMDQQISDRWFY